MENLTSVAAANYSRASQSFIQSGGFDTNLLADKTRTFYALVDAQRRDAEVNMKSFYQSASDPQILLRSQPAAFNRFASSGLLSR